MWSGPGLGGNALLGRPEREQSNRIEEQELEEAGRRHVEDEAMHAQHAHRPASFPGCSDAARQIRSPIPD